MTISRYLLLLSCLLISACAGVPTASKSEEKRAKEFISSSDRASVYIYRDQFLGSALASTVAVNGRIIGQSLGKSFFLIHLTPGKYSIVSYPGASCETTLDVRQGEKYFIWQEAKFAVNLGKCELHIVDENTGRQGVLSGEMLSSAPRGIEIPPLTGVR